MKPRKSQDPLPYCEDCEYCFRDAVTGGAVEYRCSHPAEMRTSGAALVAREFSIAGLGYCDMIRGGRQGTCGREGRLFRPKREDG